MSLIADALKTAQRERQRRAAEAASTAGAPLLVPLRGKAPPAFSWVRALAIGIGGALVVAVVLVGVEVKKSADRPPLPAVPPPPAVDLIVSPATRVRSAPDQAGATAAATAGRMDAAAGRRAAGDARVATSRTIRPAPRAVTAATTTAGPSAPRSDSSARERFAAAPQGTTSGADSRRAAASGGRLRIAVDQPHGGGPEAARLFADAVLAHRANDLATARDLYERLLVLTPNDPDLLNNLGVLLSSQREYGRATELLKRAVALAPGNAGAWANLGFSLREQSRSAEAIAAFQHALALDPKRPGARISLAQQYIAVGSLDQAREVVDRLLADDPSSAEAHYTRGQVYEMQGDVAAAVREYEDFLRLARPRLAPYAERVRRHLDTLAARTHAP